MRKPLIAGNWKMHGSKAQVTTLIHAIMQGSHAYPGTDILVCPPFVYLQQAQQLLTQSDVQLGAQNLHAGAQGAFTGEVSGTMLADVGCRYVIVGHSERRTLFNEELEQVAVKFKAAIEAQLIPILCIGETQKQREQGETEAVIHAQLTSVIEFAGIEALKYAVIAYEPVWAIGTGLTATPIQAQEVHAYIRQLIMKINVDIAKTICILYGGSMKPENAVSLLAMPDIDGGLIGGASLDAASFLAICAAAEQQYTAAKAG